MRLRGCLVIERFVGVSGSWFLMHSWEAFVFLLFPITGHFFIFHGLNVDGRVGHERVGGG